MTAGTEADTPGWVVGHAVRTTNAAESDGSRATLPSLWQGATADAVLRDLPGRVGDAYYGVLTDYESDADGAYTEVVGVGVESADVIPPGFVAVRIPDGPVRRYGFDGPAPDAVVGAWMRVWDDARDPATLERAFGTDVEIHRPDGSGEVLVSVRN